MAASGYTCVRVSLCTLNAVMWVLGCGILGVGIWLNRAHGGYATILPTYKALLSIDSLCISSGVMVVVVAFLGCCGSWFQNRCLLVTYFVLVGLVFALEFTAGTLAFVYKDDVSGSVNTEFKIGLKKHYNAKGEQGFSELWDNFQTENECCGVQSFRDWYKIDAWPSQDWVPESCCNKYALMKHNSTHCGQQGIEALFQEKGCLDKLRMWLIQKLHIIGIIILVCVFVQLFGLVSSMLLCCTIRQKRRYMKS